MSEDERLQNLALVMAATCVRNTVIENYHAAGKITDPEMGEFNKQVANKLYTFLGFMFGPAHDYEDFMKMVSANHPHKWDKPCQDEAMVNALQKVRARSKR